MTTCSLVVQVFFQRVLVLFVLLGAMLREPTLALRLDTVASELVARHARGRQQLLEIATLARWTNGRRILDAHQRFEFVLTRAALVFV